MGKFANVDACFKDKKKRKWNLEAHEKGNHKLVGGKLKKAPYFLRNLDDGEAYKGDHELGLSE